MKTAKLLTSHLRWCIFTFIITAIPILALPSINEESLQEPEITSTRSFEPQGNSTLKTQFRYNTALINDIIASYDKLDSTTDLDTSPLDTSDDASAFMTWTKRIATCACIAGALYVGYVLINEMYIATLNHLSQETNTAHQAMRDEMAHMAAHNQTLQEQLEAVQRRMENLEEATFHRCTACGHKQAR